MKRIVAVMLLSAASLVAVGCGGGTPPVLPPPGGYTGFGSYGCGIPPGANPTADPNFDIEQTIPIRMLQMSFPLVVQTNGSLELHTRRMLNSTANAIVGWGVVNIDPTAFFTDFFNWNQSLAYTALPHCFSSVSPGGTAIPGNLINYGSSSTMKVLDNFVLFSEPAKVTSHPGFQAYGVPTQKRFILRFSQGLYGGIPPIFQNGRLSQDGDFEIYYGDNQNQVYPGYMNNLRTLWGMEH